MTVNPIAQLSVSALREKLTSYGVSYGHCIEKKELQKLLGRAEAMKDKVEFCATESWQSVKSFHLCPVGLEYALDLESGESKARLQDPNEKSGRRVESSRTSEGTTTPCNTASSSSSKPGTPPIPGRSRTSPIPQISKPRPSPMSSGINSKPNLMTSSSIKRPSTTPSSRLSRSETMPSINLKDPAQRARVLLQQKRDSVSGEMTSKTQVTMNTNGKHSASAATTKDASRRTSGIFAVESQSKAARMSLGARPGGNPSKANTLPSPVSKKVVPPGVNTTLKQVPEKKSSPAMNSIDDLLDPLTFDNKEDDDDDEADLLAPILLPEEKSKPRKRTFGGTIDSDEKNKYRKFGRQSDEDREKLYRRERDRHHRDRHYDKYRTEKDERGERRKSYHSSEEHHAKRSRYEHDRNDKQDSKSEKQRARREKALEQLKARGFSKEAESNNDSPSSKKLDDPRSSTSLGDGVHESQSNDCNKSVVSYLSMDDYI